MAFVLLTALFGMTGAPADAAPAATPDELYKNEALLLDVPRLDAWQLAERALQRAESLQIAELLLEDARLAEKYAGVWKNPSFAFEGGRRRTDGSAFSGDLIGSGGSAEAVFAITVSQPIVFPGKTALRTEIAEARRRIAAFSRDETGLTIRYRVVCLAYEYSAVERLIARIQSRVDRFRLTRAYLRGRPVLSPAQRTEKDIVQRRLRFLERGLHELGVSRSILRTQLELYVGADVAPSVRWFRSGTALALEEIETVALQRSPRLLAERARIALIAAEGRLAQRDAFPDMEVFGTVENARSEQYFGAGLRFMLPLFDRNQAAVQGAPLRSRAAELGVEYERKRLVQFVRSAYAEFEHAREALARFPLELEGRTTREMSAADLAFRRGRVDLLTYLEADEQAFETVRAIYDTQLDYVRYYTELLMIAGNSTMRFESEVGAEAGRLQQPPSYAASAAQEL